MPTRWVLVLVAAPVAFADYIYQRAQAPPPPPKAECRSWCPKKTCCKTCDVPACLGCGLIKECAGAVLGDDAEATLPTLPSGTVARTDPSSQPVAPVGFQTGKDGKLYANGKVFIVKGCNWWGLEGPERGFGGLMHRSMEDLFGFLSDHGFNAVRTLINHHGVQINGKLASGSFDEGHNPDLVGKRYLEGLEVFVR